jgi:hypothetical protein
VKARYALWPVIIFSAVSLASACSSDSGTNTDPGTGGTDTTGDGGSGANTGATTSTGGIDAGGMSTDAGASTGATGGAAAGAAGAAGAGGATGDLCEGKELDCPDDDNPCTEDECNPDTGECGIPRSETACDDGKFCNGEDTCDAGECTAHAGNPCGGTCNEGGDYCECATKDDCPADELGEWSACAYATECVETAMRNRTVTKYTCNNVGKCVAGAPTIENDSTGCVRETDTLACTDDGKPCNGVEACKNGNCVGSGINPCAGQAATPFCYDSGTMCRECTGSTVANTVGCGGAEKCCKGDCIPSGNNCLIINPTIIQTSFVTAIQTAAAAP